MRPIDVRGFGAQDDDPAPVSALSSQEHGRPEPESSPSHRLWLQVSVSGLVAGLAWLLLPDQEYGPLGIVNPARIVTMFNLVLAINVVGYLGQKLLGPRSGLILAGLVGGIVSSTAVTVSMSRYIRVYPEQFGTCIVAIIAACGLMFGRIFIELAALQSSLVTTMAWPLGTTFVVALLVAWLCYRRMPAQPLKGGLTDYTTRLRDQAGVWVAVQFAGLYALVIATMKIAGHYLGDDGLYISSILAGTNDVDAITLSTIELHRQGLASSVAVRLILLAGVTNTLVKVGLCGWLGSRAAMLRVGAGLAIAVAAGLIAHVATSTS